MTTIAALVHSEQLRHHLLQLPDACGTALLCAEAIEVKAALGRGARGALLELHDGSATSLASVVRDLRLAHTAAPILIYCSPGLSVSSAILSVAQAGASGLCLHGFDDLEASLMMALRVGGPAAAADWVVRTVSPLVPRNAAEVMQCVASHPSLSPTVDGVCRVLHTNRRTLAYRLRRVEFPPPHTVVAWTRLLTAARLLENEPDSVENIALALHFRSGAAMRALFLRLTGFPPSGARTGGGYARVASLFLACGGSGRATSRGRQSS